MIRCRLRSGFRLSPGWVNAPEPPRLSVDNALKIAGEEAVHFHTSLSGVARAKAKLGFNPRPLLWKDSRTSTAAWLLSRVVTTSKG